MGEEEVAGLEAETEAWINGAVEAARVKAAVESDAAILKTKAKVAEAKVRDSVETEPEREKPEAQAQIAVENAKIRAKEAAAAAARVASLFGSSAAHSLP